MKTRRLAVPALAGFALLSSSVTPALGQGMQWKLPFVKHDELPRGFAEWHIPRRDGSLMTAFLAHHQHDPAVRKPLLVYLDGSGAQSQFTRRDQAVGYGMFGLVGSIAAEKYHVVGIEKRGAVFGEAGTPGSAQAASREYQEHATFEDRVGDACLLLATLLEEPTVDPTRVLLMGHSEGAGVAVGVAAREPRVTHVAFLSGTGPSQFFDLIVLRRKAMQKAGVPAEEIESSVGQLESDFRAILADPTSTDKLFMGHAYRRWASFGKRSAIDDMLASKCKLYLAHGSEDTNVSVESFDLTTIELLRAGRAGVTVRRFPGRDHSLRDPAFTANSPPMTDVIEDVLQWAAGVSTARP